MKLLDVTPDGKFSLAGSFLTLPLNDTDKAALINAMNGFELLSEEIEAAPKIIETVLDQIPIATIKEAVNTQLHQAFKLTPSVQKKFEDAAPLDPTEKIQASETYRKTGWVYYSSAGMLGYKDHTIRGECPHKATLTAIITDEGKAITEKNEIEVMTWLADNTFRRLPKETLEEAFRIFNATEKYKFFSKYRRLRSGPSGTGTLDIPRAPQIL